jgi:hypothetical protein
MMKQNAENHMALDSVNIQFSKPVKILNPATAFRRGDGGSSFFDHLKNWFATVTVNSLQIDSAGKISAHGKVSTLFSDSKFDQEVATIRMPLMDMSLDQALLHKVMNFIVPGAAQTRSQPNVLNDIINDVMRMSSGAKFSASATTTPAAVHFDSPWLQTSASAESAIVSGEGTLAFGAGGAVTLTADGPGIGVASPGGVASMKGTLVARRDESGRLLEEAHVDMTYLPKAMTGEFKPAVGIAIPLALNQRQARFHMRTDVNINDSQITRCSGDLEMDLPSMSSEFGFAASIGSDMFMIHGEKATASASMNFAYERGSGTTLSHGTFDMHAVVTPMGSGMVPDAEKTMHIAAKNIEYCEEKNVSRADVTVTT